MRPPTHADGELVLHLYEVRREPELRAARAWFLTEFQPQVWEQIQSGYLSHTEQDRWFRMTVGYWEMVGALVNQGVLHERVFFEHTGEDIATWQRIKPCIAEARRFRGPLFLRNFERMAERHIAYREQLVADLQRASNGASASVPARKGRTASGRRRPARSTR